MKILIYILTLTLVCTSCKNDNPKDYVTLSGKITNKTSDSLLVLWKGYTKIIDIGADGSFSDTLKVKEGNYVIANGNRGRGMLMYLKNNYDLDITVDAKTFQKTISYTGIGAAPNNYLVKKHLLEKKVLADKSIYDLNEKAFAEKTRAISKIFQDTLNNTADLDSSFITLQLADVNRLKRQLDNSYEEKQYIKTVLAKGNPSPKFSNYENHKGGTTSLDDLKGKYVYIDIWATWCVPCKKEIPYLKAIEKQYHGKNIEFVSISIDRPKDYDTWRKMVEKDSLTGIQLYAKDKEFQNAYKANYIPRFILIDPEGNIVNANAPNPSDEKLKNLFKTLNIPT